MALHACGSLLRGDGTPMRVLSNDLHPCSDLFLSLEHTWRPPWSDFGQWRLPKPLMVFSLTLKQPRPLSSKAKWEENAPNRGLGLQRPSKRRFCHA